MKGEILGRKGVLAAAVVLALSSASGIAAAGQRPLSDFTDAQQTWCAVFTSEGFLDCGASHYGTCDDGFFISFPQFWTDPKTGVTAAIDALGEFDEGDFGTVVDGSVSDSGPPNGPAEVNVIVHVHNALTRAFDLDGNPVFGHLLFEVQDGADPTLGDATLQVKFSNTARGEPLPDFNQLVSCPLPGQALEFFSIRAQASGRLREAFGVPDGTPGRLEVTQTGLIGTAAIVNPHSRVALDAFPAEHVILRVTGQ